MLNEPLLGGSGDRLRQEHIYFKVSTKPIISLRMESPCTRHTSKVTGKL